MAEVRTTSATGGQKGVKEQRHDLLPRTALDRISEVYAFGAEKYADHNWRRGYEWSKSYAAAQRHLTAWWDGEDLDPESGLSHLGHAGFHIFALLTWLEEQGLGVDNPFDDRWPHGLERARRAADDDAIDEAYEEAEEDLRPSLRDLQDRINQQVYLDLKVDEALVGGFARFSEVDWKDSAPLTDKSLETSIEAISLATGVPVEELLQQAPVVEPPTPPERGYLSEYRQAWVRDYDREHRHDRLSPAFIDEARVFRGEDLHALARMTAGLGPDTLPKRRAKGDDED